MPKKPNVSKDKSKPIKKTSSQKSIKTSTSLDKAPSMKSSRSPSNHPTPLVTKIQKISKKQSKPVVVKSECQSDDDNSIDSLHPIQETQQVKDKVLKSLAIFKNAAQEYLDKHQVLENEIDYFQSDFNMVRNELKQVFYESNRSREEMSKLKKASESPNKQANLSTKNSPCANTEILEDSRSRSISPEVKIEELKKQIDELRLIIDKNEEEIRSNDTENLELRNIAFKLQDTIDVSDGQKEPGSALVMCKACCIS